MWSLVCFKIPCTSCSELMTNLLWRNVYYTLIFCFVNFYLFIYLVVVVVLGIEHRTLLPGKQAHFEWAASQPFLYILNFEIGPHSFTPAGPKLWCFCLRFPSSWDHRSVLCLVLEKLLCCFTAASRMFFPLPTAHGRIRGNRQLFITSRSVCLGHMYLDTEHLQGPTQWRWSFEWFWSL